MSEFINVHQFLKSFGYSANDSDEEILDFFFDIDSHSSTEYKYIENYQYRPDDGYGLWSNFIFERLSDGKYFYYPIYDERIEDYSLFETKKVMKWDID